VRVENAQLCIWCHLLFQHDKCQLEQPNTTSGGLSVPAIRLYAADGKWIINTTNGKICGGE
jgi:hypothetical protein